MKKKIIFLIILCSILISNVFAEPKLTNDGAHYSVKEAYCTYKGERHGLDWEYKIYFKDDKIDEVADYDKNGNEKTARYSLETLTYKDFFKDKDFKCPNEIYVNPTDAKGQLFYNACDKLDGECETRAIVTLKVTDFDVTYNESDGTDNTPQKERDFACQYTKLTSNVGSVNQSLSANVITYQKYKDGTAEFFDSNNGSYPITSGSLDSCSDNLYLKMNISGQTINSYSIVNSCNDNSDTKCVMYTLSSRYSGNNSVDSNIQNDGTSKPYDPINSNVDSNLNFEDGDTCESFLGRSDNKDDPAYYLHFAFKLLKYAAIILLLALTVVDFFKAETSQNQDALKKALQATVKRLIIAAVIFFLPILIEFLFELFGIYTDPSCIVGGVNQ